ncbi:MAG: beta-N-acetylhexosaminidase [Bacteroidales bacterium]|nr:beta-N-acetylhexosaminidase [Bacteroidales bacterium]
MKSLKLLTLLTLVAIISSCHKPEAQPFTVIPMPNSVEMGEGVFKVAGADIFVEEALPAEVEAVVERFADKMARVSGKCNQISRIDNGQKIKVILNSNLGPEAYALQATPQGMVIEASERNGFIYAFETLKQMLPAEVYGSSRAWHGIDWVIPAVSIVDEPRFAYRGMHLDPCRHFFDVNEVKRYIDIMATYKLNRFHFHLTEDQGWRIEIKAYPKLTEIGAWRDGTMIGHDWDSNDGIRYGGYYTQDELREIVAYADERGITVIPEIDLPGHMLAALAAYPELGCTGGPYKVWHRWGVSNDILCAGNEEVFTFLEKVFAEILDIFPSEYIHIGGDECFGDGDIPWDNCPKCAARMKELGIKKSPEARHYLQNYVTARVQEILAGMGRKVIGWDEILEGELAPGATVMSWRGVEGGIEASAKGFDAIMTPYTFLYFDYYQGPERDKEPIAIGGNLPVEKVYSYEPFDGIVAGAEDHILGVQANLWTEYISSNEQLEYMLLPRMCALSEIQWCDADRKDFTRFNESLDHAFRMFDVMGYNYSLDIRCLVGMDRIPARTAEQLTDYLTNGRK